MQEERPYWNMEIEPMLNTPEMREIQLKKLKVFLRRLCDNAPFYKKQFDELGVVPEKINSLNDFSSAVPLFDKEGLRAMVVEFGGDILAVLDQIMPVSVDDLSIMSTTTGTTGIPTPYPMTWHDMEDVWGEAMVRGCWRAGVRSHDRVLFCFALSMVIAGIPSMMGMHRLGAMAIPVGAEAGTDRILLMQALFRGTVYWPITSWRNARSRGGTLRTSASTPCSAAESRGRGYRRCATGWSQPSGRAYSTPGRALVSPAITRSTRACTGQVTTWPSSS
jgi:phenylacetate-CoA ligase